MLTIQRSIPIPPVKLEKILNYIKYVCERDGADPEELKKAGLDFGRGIGDITRFLKNIEVVTIVQGKVKICEQSLCKDIENVETFKSKFHKVLYEKLPQYQIIYNIIKEKGKINIEELYTEANIKISEISPSSWINKVAFRTVLTFLTELGLIKKTGNTVEHISKTKLDTAIACLKEKISKIGTRYYLSVKEIAECLNVDMTTVLEKAKQGNYIRFVKAPSTASLLELKDIEKGIRELVNLILTK